VPSTTLHASASATLQYNPTFAQLPTIPPTTSYKPTTIIHSSIQSLPQTNIQTNNFSISPLIQPCINYNCHLKHPFERPRPANQPVIEQLYYLKHFIHSPNQPSPLSSSLPKHTSDLRCLHYIVYTSTLPPYSSTNFFKTNSTSQTIYNNLQPFPIVYWLARIPLFHFLHSYIQHNNHPILSPYIPTPSSHYTQSLTCFCVLQHQPSTCLFQSILLLLKFLPLTPISTYFPTSTIHLKPFTISQRLLLLVFLLQLALTSPGGTGLHFLEQRNRTSTGRSYNRISMPEDTQRDFNYNKFVWHNVFLITRICRLYYNLPIINSSSM